MQRDWAGAVDRGRSAIGMEWVDAGSFDLVRVEKGMIKEHWDEAVINAPQPARGN